MNNSEFKALISLLDDEDVEVYNNVSDKIVSLGQSIIPHLESAWENTFNPFVQNRIEELVHTLQFNSTINRLQEWRESDSEDLLKGLWIVSLYQYPDFEFDKLNSEVEQMYYDAWPEFKEELHPYDQIKLLNSIMFNKFKFSSNLKNFHSPSNSFINCVLETKRGNPISLCVVYMIMARKLNIPVYGVNLPNLFILTYKTERIPQFYINAYNRGIIFTRNDIENYVKELKIESKESYFEPCTNIDIVRRVFSNLMASYEKAGERQKALEIGKLRAILA